MRASLLVGLLSLVGATIATVASCAHGGDTAGFHQVGGSSPTTSELGGGGIGGSPTTTTPTRTITTTDTSSGGSTGTSTIDGSGGGGAGCDHVGSMMCTAATDITHQNGASEFDGDTNSDTRIEHGQTSAWFKLTITEGSDFANDLSVDAQLQSPPGMQYDLYVYGDANGASCQGSATKGFGTPAELTECWSDNYPGTDDTQDRLFEVRYVSGDFCGPEAQWTLTIRGNYYNGSCP